MTEDPWTTRFFPREGDGTGFDRVVFFSDAVFAIALTLMAVGIGIPAISDPSSPGQLVEALRDKIPNLLAFAVAFLWVAFYWRANHRFTRTLRGMTSTYIACVLVYLGFVALLPFPAGLLGEYWQNPAAVAVFAVFAACMSTMEVVLFVCADRQGLFIRPLTSAFRRQSIVGSLTPVPAFLLSIPVAFISTGAAIATWLLLGLVSGWAVNRWLPASPP